MTPRMPRRWAAVSLAGIMVAAGCSGAGATTAPPVLGTRIDVRLSEFRIDLSATSAAVGAVTFAITNSGSTDHELVVIEIETPAADLQVVDHKVVEQGLDIVGEVPSLGRGGTTNLPITLAPGHYVLICNIAAHYESGMRADFAVR